MVRFGILSPPSRGHLNGMIALGVELLSRGHEVIVFSAIDAESMVVGNGLNFIAIGEMQYPRGSVMEASNKLGQLSGLEALKYTIKLSRNTAQVALDNTPAALYNANIEALLIDQSMIEGRTIAEIASIPFITICNALLLDPDPNVPSALSFLDYDNSWLGTIRNELSHSFFGFLGSSIGKMIEDFRRQSNLPLATSPNFNNLVNSNLAIISQQPLEFDFPRNQIPPNLHFVGLFADHSVSRESID